MSKTKIIDQLFSENEADKTKDQSYKDTLKEYDLPEKYYLLEMYNKQKELQEFLATKGRTGSIPPALSAVRQTDVQLAIYHLYCMQVELKELQVELKKIEDFAQCCPISKASLVSETGDKLIDARFELIDLFFFMFNVGIYTAVDIYKVVDIVSERIQNTPVFCDNGQQMIRTSSEDLTNAIDSLINYIDKLPWKAWKEYDYEDNYKKLVISNNTTLDNSPIQLYASAISSVIYWAHNYLGEDATSLFNLYMHKWNENKRRQIDVHSGYNVVSEQSLEQNDAQ